MIFSYQSSIADKKMKKIDQIAADNDKKRLHPLEMKPFD